GTGAARTRGLRPGEPAPGAAECAGAGAEPALGYRLRLAGHNLPSPTPVWTACGRRTRRLPSGQCRHHPLADDSEGVHGIVVQPDRDLCLTGGREGPVALDFTVQVLET